MHPYLNTAFKAARAAGDIITRAFDRLDTVRVSKKGKNDFVTNVDKAAEQEIIRVLQMAYPHHEFLCEESGSIKGSGKDEFQWIIDPLDGTTNFMRGFPHFCISIALKHNNRIEHGLIYDPLRQDLFTASRGTGAQKNNRRIRVAQHYHLKECLLGTGFPFKTPKYHDIYYDSLKAISKHCIGIRRTGSAALDLAYVASGQLDAFWEFGLSTWDIAAGSLIIRESGGLITDVYGEDNYLKTGNVVCGNPRAFKELLNHLKPFLPNKP